MEGKFLFKALEIMSAIFVFLIGLLFLVLLVVYIVDVTQKKQAIRRNFPVIGHFRYLFERLGTFFRQYFFAMDREELPFNRAMRSWVYRAAKNVSNTVAFGSTRDLRPPGTLLFVNCAFPTLGKDSVPVSSMVIGENIETPFRTESIFNISGMSYGAISKPAIQALSHGAKMAGCWLNTGEGGLSPFHLEGGCDLVFQIGTAKYGVRDANGKLDHDKLRELAGIPQVRMFELKLSQGAKPGKGGLLPAEKVTEEIARVRGIPVGEASISPNRHPEIKSVADLLDMINDIRQTTQKPVGFKFVVGDYQWIRELIAEINARGIASAPDFITIDSADGGSGAAPASLIDYMGLPVRESLPGVARLLKEHGLKERIKLIASGKLITPGEVAWALCAGADFVTSARGFMFALGCIQAMDCNKNTCPTGITTHNKRLQKGLDPQLKSVRVCQYVNNLIHEICQISHSCGVSEPRQMNARHVRVVNDLGQSEPLETVISRLNLD